MKMIYFVAGAIGSGKTALIPELKKALTDKISIIDFDDISVPEDLDTKRRQQLTENLLHKFAHDKNNTIVIGQVVLGEILACPSAKYFDKINFCLLDTSDFERINRLKNHKIKIDQNLLNWSSWLRMHHQDPQWMQNMIKENCWEGLDFISWDNARAWDNIANVMVLDTSSLAPNQVAQSVSSWILENQQNGEVIADTSYKLYRNAQNAYHIIDQNLFDYNKKCVPSTQDPEVINFHYVVKDNDDIIAGIGADVYIWKILYISVLFVHEKYRDKKLGTFLLKQVEEKAKDLGVKLAHTDTFDFQAKDFYLKHGYEIFGVLDDCPAGHKRYYLKKNL